MTPEWEQALAADRARYPLPSEMRGEEPGRRLESVQDLLANLKARFPLPSEMRRREAERAAQQARREEAEP